MIKRLTFAARPTEASTAPDDARPFRVAVASVLPGVGGPSPVHDVVVSEWFADAAHLDRFEAWSAVADIGAPRSGLGPVVVVEEHVRRGGDWLAARWRDGGTRYKHVALAARAAGLSPAELSERWLAHAGRSGGVVIPEEARGRAYVQDHPVPRLEGEWAYDAVTEVWFDDEASLRTRIAWFAEHPPAPDDLFARSWFLATTEEVVG